MYLVTNNYRLTYQINNAGNSKDVQDNIKDILSIILILNVNETYRFSRIRSNSFYDEKYYYITSNTEFFVSNAEWFRYVKTILLYIRSLNSLNFNFGMKKFIETKIYPNKCILILVYMYVHTGVLIE